MKRRTAERLEAAMDIGAATLLAAAAGYALYALAIAQTGVAVTAAGTFGLCLTGLRRIPPAPAVPELLVALEHQPTPVSDLLAEADRSLASGDAAQRPNELVLEDILSAVRPDSRVTRLFEPRVMPAPGPLKAQVDRHIGNASPPDVTPDASQALYDALAELRRSLN